MLGSWASLWQWDRSLFSLVSLSFFYSDVFCVKDKRVLLKNRLETFIKTQKKERKFNNDISNFREGIIVSQRKTFQLWKVRTLGRYLKARTHFEKRQTKLLRLIRALNNKTFPFLYYVFKFVKGHRIMSANPFAALGEDGPNPVAAKGAIFFGKEMLTGIRLVSRRGANCKRNRHRESSTRDLFSLKTNRNQRKYNSCVRIDWF